MILIYLIYNIITFQTFVSVSTSLQVSLQEFYHSNVNIFNGIVIKIKTI